MTHYRKKLKHSLTQSLRILAVIGLSLAASACVPEVVGPIDCDSDPSACVDGFLGSKEAPPAVLPATLKVTSLNIECPLPGGCTKAKLESLAEAIRSHDIVFLQEAFWDDISSQLARLSPFRYYVRGPKAQSGKTTTGGTAILSKYPIETYVDHPYSRCVAQDCVLSKGVQLAVLKLSPNDRIAVMNTHLATPYPNLASQSTHVAQLDEIGQFMSQQSSKIAGLDALPLVFGGDFNFARTGFFAEPESVQAIDSLVSASSLRLTNSGMLCADRQEQVAGSCAISASVGGSPAGARNHASGSIDQIWSRDGQNLQARPIAFDTTETASDHHALTYTFELVRQ